MKGEKMKVNGTRGERKWKRKTKRRWKRQGMKGKDEDEKERTAYGNGRGGGCIDRG